jgi:hypothetical protein
MLMVHHDSHCGVQPDRCVLPSLALMLSESWAAASVQALRSPSDQLFGLEVVFRGRHTVSPQMCLRRTLVAAA